MHRQPAKVLEPADVCLVLKHVKHHRHPLRNQIMVLLSFKAGLRACEIARLDWSMVLQSDGKVGRTLRIRKYIAKGRSRRSIPMHKALAKKLRALHKHKGKPLNGPVVMSERGGSMSARSVVNWFHGLYHELGLLGCSSHSGRRTFITQTARALIKTGGSLRDIQELAGHRARTTTERYIEGDRLVQHRLVALL